jgi:replicative DNA helicase
LSEALSWGIREEDFITDEGRNLFSGLVQASRDPRNRRGQMGVNAVKSYYPDFVFCHDKGMTLEALCTNVRKSKNKLELQTVSREIINGNGDPLDIATRAVERLQRNILAVGYGAKADVSLIDAFERNLEDHDMKQDGVDTSVAKWPWEAFNAATNGVQSDDYIVFYGRPKSKKTWMLTYFIASIFAQGKTPLIYTKEMTADNMFRRITACLGEIPYQAYRHGRLTPEQREHMGRILSACRDVRRFQDIIILDAKDSQGNDTVDWLQAKADKYKPNMIFIDGMYLMKDSKGGKGQKDNFRVQNISRDIRQMVLTLGIPVAATLQATRSASGHQQANLEEISFSDSVGQDATAIMRVVNENRHPDYNDRDIVNLIVGGSREWQFSGCRVYAECAECFDYIGPLDEREVEKINAKEDKKEEKAKAKPNGRTTEVSATQAARSRVKEVDDLVKRTPRRAA